MNWAPQEPASQSPIVIDITPEKTTPVPAERNLFARFKAIEDGDLQNSDEPRTPLKGPPAINEMDDYLELDTVPQDVTLLEWWADHSDQFPHLALMARQFLSVPATSASAERLFSLAGANYSDHRKNMTDEHLADLLFAKINVFMNRRFQATFMKK